jgi:hypothetical protein
LAKFDTVYAISLLAPDGLTASRDNRGACETSTYTLCGFANSIWLWFSPSARECQGSALRLP